MKKFFEEFKKFITRGNVVDMAVGVIVGSSFTAIVNGLSNYILKPIINWLLALVFGKDSLSSIYTFLVRVEKSQDVLDAEGNVIGTEMVPDLTQSIYIDWGSFINAVINFFIVAFVLFTIVKIMNKIREEHKEFNQKLLSYKLTKEDKKILKSRGIKRTDLTAIEAYVAEKKAAKEAEAKKKAAEAEEKAKLERAANPTTEDLLKEILAELKSRA
ncbi:MAG: large conductance mechanosensitive channel protein MscL [Clostridia bacterium]|nr:large conductance mechanosensitive channel protein MscL [Clostridia bacterium]